MVAVRSKNINNSRETASCSAALLSLRYAVETYFAIIFTIKDESLTPLTSNGISFIFESSHSERTFEHVLTLQ